eukprot:TRINITY_DN12201_c0_g1_i8.p1 TRINITY_DN12201_c0_g1~~TRINITY_DN12201_c0_g1_i8.p1  ORF type:complete len:219 (+),score=84.53 TRINITY_DN12201_c0_g1_i8:190-846(+)
MSEKDAQENETSGQDGDNKEIENSKEEEKTEAKKEEPNLGMPKRVKMKVLRDVEEYKYDQIPYEEILEFDGNALTPIEIDRGEHVFAALDKDDNGYIEPADMRAALDMLHVNLERSVYKEFIEDISMIPDGKINKDLFLEIIHKYTRLKVASEDKDTLMAFISMGGEADGSGSISADRVRKIIKDEFQMTVDIDKMLNEVDFDGSGSIEYDEFKTLLS